MGLDKDLDKKFGKLNRLRHDEKHSDLSYSEALDKNPSYRKERDDNGKIIEWPEANPDVLSEDDSLYHRPLSAEGEAKMEAIRESLYLLSPRQKQVLQLCGFEGMTMKKAAKLLGLKIPTVQWYLEEAKLKIVKYYEDKKLSNG